VNRKTTFSPLVVLLTSHQLNPIDEQQNDHSNVESSVPSSARPMLSTSYEYWLNTGDNHDNHPHSTNFMRSTYAAKCRSHLSRSIERCPRDGRGIQPFPPFCIVPLSFENIRVSMLCVYTHVCRLLCFGEIKNDLI
jgi:hypothetical protein